MEYTNSQNPSGGSPRDFLSRPANLSPSVNTVESNRSETESTESRLFGAYRNTNQALRDLTPVSTPDAPLVYPVMDEFNMDTAQELNNQTMPPSVMGPVQMPESTTRPRQSMSTQPAESVPMPTFTTAARTRNATAPETYTPLGDKTPPTNSNVTSSPYLYRNNNNTTNISYQFPPLTTSPTSTSPVNQGITSGNSYPNLATDYRLADNNMYLPTRTTPYYNISSDRNEDLSDFEAAERDMDYLKRLYPSLWQMLQAEVEEECDKLEYEGSCMFDEYPDQITLDRIIRRIYDRIKDREDLQPYNPPTESGNVSASQVNYRPYRRSNWLEDYLRIMFLNEMFNRRRRYRNRRRWFF